MNIVSHTSVINTYAVSKRPRKAQLAYELTDSAPRTARRTITLPLWTVQKDIARLATYNLLLLLLLPCCCCFCGTQATI